MNTISAMLTAALDTAEAFPRTFVVVGTAVGFLAIVVAVCP